MNDKYVFAKDIESGPYVVAFDRIKKENNALYLHLVTSLEKGGSVGIRSDVIAYFSENASDITKDEKFLFHLTSIACNPKVTSEHVQYVNEYFSRNVDDKRLPIDDFAVVFTACVEKDIPISEIRELLSSGKDAVEIFGIVAEYISKPEPVVEEKEEDIYVPEVTERKETYKVSPKVEEKQAEEPSDVDMFNNLVSVMTYQGIDDSRALDSVQEDFSGIIDKMQNLAAAMSTSSMEFLNAMKKDKEQIQRLNAMITLMKKLLEKKQFEIDDLRGQIIILNEKIRSSERAKFRMDAMNEKISELNRFAFNDDDDDLRFLH